MNKVLLITPPFTQLNTPYPATAYLKGFLNAKKIASFQIDLGIEVILELFSKNGIINLFNFAIKKNQIKSSNSQRILTLKSNYINTIDDVIAFLQHKNQTLARQICAENFLPQASRFKQLDDLNWAFGSMGMQDKAKHLATLYLEDLSDFITECVDDNFGFSRYAEKLGKSANSFDLLHDKLKKETTYIDNITLEILNQKILTTYPSLICFSVPFPGNLYSAFRSAQFIKTKYPSIKIAMGGGFPNTELRSISDIRVFDFFDFITLDDGELPLELLYQHIVKTNKSDTAILKRTFLKENNEVIYSNNSIINDYPFSKTGTPDYTDLLLHKYISVIEIANPMHSLWSDGRWNKLTMAHGCYWGKCTFCDITLDYIKNYEPIAATIIVDRIEQIMAQTGEKGFHFVDEAAPPSLMRDVAIEIIKRKLNVTWWTNIRFEKSFTPDVCKLLQESGCVAVSGGLEVASDRLLSLIKKGVTVKQVAQVTRNFTDSGIMVHAYLMYGFPTQTTQETVDSLEMVRQLFELGSIQSGFWHQFALTTHSPININYADYDIKPTYKEITFANNDLEFEDKIGINHTIFSYGLKKSLYNYMHGIGFELSLQDWFDFKIPKTHIPQNYIQNCIDTAENIEIKPTSKIIWMGNNPTITTYIKTKKGMNKPMLLLLFNNKTHQFELKMEQEKGRWLVTILEQISIYQSKFMYFDEIKSNYKNHFEDFELFWYSKPLDTLRANGLLII